MLTTIPLRHVRPYLALLVVAAVLPSCSSGPDAYSVADRDKDGKLSKQELGLALLNGIYAAGDQNGDAKITWEEWSQVDPKADRKEFALRDTDRDGAVTPAELKAFSEGRKSFDRLFGSIDQSGDGFADRAEVKEFHTRMMEAEGETEMQKLLNYTRE